MVYPKAECYRDSLTERVYVASKESQEHVSFNRAQEICREMGGTLAEIRSLYEQSLLSSLSSVDSAWIGLKSPSKNEKWAWLSGKTRKIETREDFWTSNDVAVAADERCAAIDARGTRHNVAVRNCHDKLDYICEFKSVTEAPEICTVRLFLSTSTDTWWVLLLLTGRAVFDRA